MHARACDFLFTGASIFPGFLMYAGEPGLAIMACVALTLAGGVCAIADPQAPHHQKSP